MRKSITLHLDEDLYFKAKKKALSEQKIISYLVDYWMKEYVEGRMKK